MRKRFGKGKALAPTQKHTHVLLHYFLNREINARQQMRSNKSSEGCSSAEDLETPFRFYSLPPSLTHAHTPSLLFISIF